LLFIGVILWGRIAGRGKASRQKLVWISPYPAKLHDES